MATPLSKLVIGLAKGVVGFLENGALACVAVASLGTCQEAWSQALAPPDVVKLPAGLDLGGSSYYDGFGRTDPGWVFIDYARWNDFTSIKDSNGRSSPF